MLIRAQVVTCEGSSTASQSTPRIPETEPEFEDVRKDKLSQLS